MLVSWVRKKRGQRGSECFGRNELGESPEGKAGACPWAGWGCGLLCPVELHLPDTKGLQMDFSCLVIKKCPLGVPGHPQKLSNLEQLIFKNVSLWNSRVNQPVGAIVLVCGAGCHPPDWTQRRRKPRAHPPHFSLPLPFRSLCGA